jgi:hypothetical protein
MTKPFGPLVAALYEYWNRKRAGRAMPDRKDIDPSEMPRGLLPYLFMVDFSGQPRRWRYRLMGTEMVNRLGVDLTGRYLDEALGTKYRHYLIALNNELLERKRPFYTESLLHSETGSVLLTKRMLVPLMHLGREPAMILGAETYHGTRAAPPHSLVLTERGDIEELARRVLEI